MPKDHLIDVLHLTPIMENYGLERGVLPLVKYMNSLGEHSVVGSSGGSLINSLHQINVSNITLKSNNVGFLKIWNDSNKIAKAVVDYKINLIHSHARSYSWSSHLYRRRSGSKIPIITTLHAIYNNQNRRQKFYNSIMCKSDKMIAVSHFAKAHAISEYSADESKIVVIPRGIDYKYFDKRNIEQATTDRLRLRYNAPKSTPIILLPSKFTRWKGHLLLIEALKLIRDLDFYCIIVGHLGNDPEFLNTVAKRIKENKMQSKVQLYGLSDDVATLYAMSDIILSTSIEPEAFPKSVIEGQSMEKIVIGSNIGATPELIQDNVNGFCFEANSPESLAEKIRHAISILNSETSTNIGLKARKSVIENFSLEEIHGKIVNLYKNLV
ncbi:MAG: glycosyltransferase family 4 protein [Rickettsiaceae bacterium]|nr:glycosyltransferase family 4 protein [Rickettsiaceae bacterium]